MITAGFVGNGMLFVAFLLVLIGYLLRRSARRQTAKQESVAPFSAVDAAIKRLEACEARLNEYERSTNASFQVRTNLLKTLIAEADVACLPLRQKDTTDLSERGCLPTDRRSLAGRLLRQAGYSEEQVAKLIERLVVEEIQLSDDHRRVA